MLCLNKFLVSATPFSIANSPNSQPNHSTFRPRLRTPKVFHSPQVYNDNGGERKALTLPPSVKTISSTSNPFVKHCVKLRQNSSYRHFHGLVLVVGSTPIREICCFRKTSLDRPIIEYLLVLDNYQIPEDIFDPAVRVIRVNSAIIGKISGVQSIDSVEIIALFRIPSTFHIVNDNLKEEDCRSWFPFPHRILVLDGIQDPGNLGTLLRSATAFKWGGVFLLPGCCDPFNEKALRACRGACFRTPIVSGNWKHIEAMRSEFEMKLFAAHPATSDKQNLVSTLSKDFADSVVGYPLCLVLGSEGTGLSEFSKKTCELISIPMSGEFESLNVSVAGGIFMYMLQPQ